MTYIMLFAAVAGVLGAASPSANGRADNRAQVRASWAPADSADSLWREARGAFSDGDWKRAADLFARIRTRFPRSAYAGDSHYYEAFALYKVGDASGLRRALTLLETQGSRYAGAATVKNHEARSLATRIKGALARGGDATSAEDIAVSTLFGENTPCSSTTGQSGHTLGAAGIVEAIVSALAIRHGFLPGSPNTETVDPSFRIRYQIASEPAYVDTVLSNSFGFGGSNCSLIFGKRR